MSSARTPSAGRELSAAEQGKREKNLAHLLIIAHDQGVPAAIAELRRMRAEKRAKARVHQPPKAQTRGPSG